MKQFEYLRLTTDGITARGIFDNGKIRRNDFNIGLDNLGLQGWDMVNFTSEGYYMFKREIPQSPEQTQERPHNGHDDGYGR
jgi:hypothetical protein